MDLCVQASSAIRPETSYYPISRGINTSQGNKGLYWAAPIENHGSAVSINYAINQYDLVVEPNFYKGNLEKVRLDF